MKKCSRKNQSYGNNKDLIAIITIFRYLVLEDTMHLTYTHDFDFSMEMLGQGLKHINPMLNSPCLYLGLYNKGFMWYRTLGIAHIIGYSYDIINHTVGLYSSSFSFKGEYSSWFLYDWVYIQKMTVCFRQILSTVHSFLLPICFQISWSNCFQWCLQVVPLTIQWLFFFDNYRIM